MVRRLLDDGRSFASDLDLEGAIRRTLEHVRDATGARYAAIGVVNEDGSGLERFLTAGLDDRERREIGSGPHGRGVLGVLIERPGVLRLADVSEHPGSYGFPARHPRMQSFLGVPIMVEGRLWGNVYLTDKDEGEFTELDEATVVRIVDRAAIAIEIALKYERSERLRRESEHAARHLEVTRDVMVTLGDELELERALEVVAKRGRALVGARSVVLWLRDGEELVASATAGHANPAHTARGRDRRLRRRPGAAERKDRAQPGQDLGPLRGCRPRHGGQRGRAGPDGADGPSRERRRRADRTRSPGRPGPFQQR